MILKIKHINKEQLKIFIQYIEIFLVITISVSPILSTNMVILLCLFLLLKNVKYFYFTSNFMLGLVICFFIPSVLDLINAVNEPYSLTNFMYPMYYICGYVLAKKYTQDSFWESYEKVMFILTILSLLGMSIYYLAPTLILTFPTYIMNKQMHHTLFFFNYLFVGDYSIVRNSGIAWEPGVFQMLLNMALLIVIRKKKSKSRILKIAVYVLAIYLTRSTMGYIVLIFLIATIVKENKWYLVLIIGIVISYFPQLMNEYSYQISNKLWGSNAFNARYEPMVNAFKMSWYKLYGLGSTGYNIAYRSYDIGSFDSYTQILLRYGYPLLINLISKIINVFRNDFIMGCIIAISLFSEPLWGCLLINMIFFLVKGEKRNEKNQ